MEAAQELSEAGKYLAGAYLVFLALVLVYVAIMAGRLSRIEREVGELVRRLDERGSSDAEAAEPRAEVHA